MHPDPSSGPDRVHIWLIRTDLPAPLVAPLRALLDPDELRRADEFREPEAARRFVVAHGALRLILAAHTGSRPRDLDWHRGPNGKPELVGGYSQVNLSHSGGLAAVAITGRRPVGVDVERGQGEETALRMSGRYYRPGEAEFVAAGSGPAERVGRFVRLWTRKEACVKAAGGRLFQGLGLPVHDPGGPAGIRVHDPGGPMPGPYLVQDVIAPQGFWVAVALAGDDPYQVSPRWWQPPEVEESG